MTLSNEAVREEAVEDSLETGPQAQTHAQRARSLAAALPPAEPADDAESLPGMPELVREWLLEHLGPAVARARKHGAAFAAREFDVIHGPPPTLARMHERHRVAASHWNAALIRRPRVAWGWLHTALAAVLYAALDALFSPVGAILAALFVLACITYWL